MCEGSPAQLPAVPEDLDIGRGVGLEVLLLVFNCGRRLCTLYRHDIPTNEHTGVGAFCLAAYLRYCASFFGIYFSPQECGCINMCGLSKTTGLGVCCIL